MQPQKAEADQADGKPHPQGYSLRLFHVGGVICRYGKKPSPSGAADGDGFSISRRCPKGQTDDSEKRLTDR